MGLKTQRISKPFGGFAAVNGVTLEIPYGPIGIIPAPRGRKAGKRPHIFSNFLSSRLNLISSFFQRFSHGERARAMEGRDRVEVTDQAPRRALTLPEGHQQQPGLILANEPPYIFWQFK
jgi:hypothetical protein